MMKFFISLSENYEQPPEVLLSSQLDGRSSVKLTRRELPNFKTRHGDVVFVELDFSVSSDSF